MTNATENAIREWWSEARDTEKLSVIREMNSYNGCFDGEEWFDMDEFDELCDGMKPWDVARAITFGDFNATHDYFRWDAYGNFESADYPDFDVDEDDIIDNLDSIPEKYWPWDLKAFADLEDEEDEEEEDEEFNRYCEQFMDCKECPLYVPHTPIEDCYNKWKAIEQRAQQEAKF